MGGEGGEFKSLYDVRYRHSDMDKVFSLIPSVYYITTYYLPDILIVLPLLYQPLLI